MKINRHGELQYITFDNITDTGFVNHAFSTRVGGVSQNQFTSLNFGFAKGDNREAVLENYHLMGEAAGFDWRNIVFSNQVHKTNVHIATESDRGSGILYDSKVRDTDAFITNCENVVLQTFYADCVPLFFADPIKRVVGAAHAGWMGTLAEIGRITVESMTAVFGTNPADIMAGIGPSIGPNHFEVHSDVADKFFIELPFSAEFIKPVGHKYLIDLWAINRRTLENVGVPSENIEVAGLCTYEHPELFYSHRAMGFDRGTMAAFIEIKAGQGI